MQWYAFNWLSNDLRLIPDLLPIVHRGFLYWVVLTVQDCAEPVAEWPRTSQPFNKQSLSSSRPLTNQLNTRMPLWLLERNCAPFMSSLEPSLTTTWNFRSHQTASQPSTPCQAVERSFQRGDCGLNRKDGESYESVYGKLNILKDGGRNCGVTEVV